MANDFARPRNEDKDQDENGDLEVDTVARRAFDRYRARGEEHGRDQEDWYEAERALRRERRGTPPAKNA